MSTYACVAGTIGGARCRNAASKEGRCHEHPAATLAPPANVVLVKCNTSHKRADALANAGVRVQSADWQKREQQHIAQAQAHDRQAHRYRQVADSGVPVFGTEGLQDASVAGLRQELGKEYGLKDVHLLPHRDKQVTILVLVFEKGAEAMRISPAVEALIEKITGSTYGFVHVWANPPQQDGKVVHTVNCTHRLDTPAKNMLVLNNEWFDAPLWDAEETR